MRAICFGSSRFQPANIVVPSFINCLHSVCSFLVTGKNTRISGSGALTRFHEHIYNVERRGYISCFSINNVFVHCPNKTNTNRKKDNSDTQSCNIKRKSVDFVHVHKQYTSTTVHSFCWRIETVASLTAFFFTLDRR